jgi:hypothetical protein
MENPNDLISFALIMIGAYFCGVIGGVRVVRKILKNQIIAMKHATTALQIASTVDPDARVKQGKLDA